MFVNSPYYKDIEIVCREENKNDLSNLDVQYHINYDQLNYCYHKLNKYFGDPSKITYLLESIPYLNSPIEDINKWVHLKTNNIENKTISIAINWCGKVTNPIEHERKIPLDEFATLNELPFLRIYTIQKEQGLDQIATIKNWKHPENVYNLSDSIDIENGFQDTMAIIKQMDVFVTSDTSVCHVAGALDHPTWVLVNYNSEWRWGAQDNDKCMWYKSITIYRQHKYHSWKEIFQEVKQDLIKLYDAKYTQ
jgi:hypothetical protein